MTARRPGKAGEWHARRSNSRDPRVLRGLASRAPYFHNGSARSLDDVVNFYDKRFKIGFTSQEKEDLIAFLSAL